MAMSYYPYSGDQMTYGMGPEYNFFRDTGSGVPSQGAAPTIVPSWAAIESGGQSLDTTNISGSAGGGGGDYSPSGSVLSGVSQPSTPANFNSNFGTIGGTVGSAIGTAAGVPGLGMVGGAVGEGIDLSRYADMLGKAGINIDPNYASAALAGASSLPFGLGNLLGTSARQQFEDARRTNGLAEGKIEGNMTTGDRLGMSQETREAFMSTFGREPTLSEMTALANSQIGTSYAQAYGQAPSFGFPDLSTVQDPVGQIDPENPTTSYISGVPAPMSAAPPSFDPVSLGMGYGSAPGGYGAMGAPQGQTGYASGNWDNGQGGNGGAQDGSGGGSASNGADATGNGGGNTGSDSFGGGGGWGGGKRGGRVTKRGKIKPYADGGAVGTIHSPLYGVGGPIAGAGDGQSDSVPAMVDGQQPAALSDGEHVFPADVVSMIGSGSTNAGHKKIARTIAQIRQKSIGRKRQMRPFTGTSIAQLVA